MGKLTNLLATDFGVIEQRLTNVLIIPVFPIMLIGSSAIMVFRVGWIGLVAIGIVIVLILIANAVSVKGIPVVTDISKFRDQRVSLTTEVVEGIKEVKLYGWEHPFKKIISNVRN
jgi:ATP-binding cassette, subfamily C (CFTR/MRP), member 1